MPHANATKGDWLGSMAGTAQIKGDIVGPAVDSRDWDVLKK